MAKEASTEVAPEVSNPGGMISSEAELAEYLKDSANVGGDEQDAEDDDEAAPTDKKGAGKKKTDTATQGKKGPTAATVENESGIPEEVEDKDEEEEEEEVEYKNVPQYLNERYGMGLNLENVPADLSREDEAEMVGKIFERVQNGAAAVYNKLKVYEKYEKNPEVQAVLKGLSEGKTLKDYIQQYAGTNAGAPDDVLVQKHFKTQFPDMTDAEITAMVEENREKGRIPKLAEAARKFYKTSDEAATAAAAKAEQDAEAAEEAEYKQNVSRIGSIIKNTNKVYGVELTPQIKQSLFEAITVRDQDGLTAHDRALQSDQGIIRSSLGLFLLDKLVKDAGSLKGNKSKKQFMDTIFDKPSQLQSREESRSQPEFSAEIANTW